MVTYLHVLQPPLVCEYRFFILKSVIVTDGLEFNEALNAQLNYGAASSHFVFIRSKG